MRISIGSDHAGFELKEKLEEHLRELGHEVTDVGTHTNDSVDYPDLAAAVGAAVARGEAERGVLVCGSGIGVAIAANKMDGVRAANVYDPEMAKMSRLHNDANVVTMGGRYLPEETAREIVDTFLATAFEGGRHQRRVDKIAALERDRA
ncbi:MAG: ribose 5-phosphate isomerase B [Anaerosomatales bacterium]|nr:ribose 5-phosphate isomerase B [Anaerosomatales bacterium]MDT8434748.1 ribose 5-phosphate isomerase B [Anaerosomatales bacterium]